MLDELLPMLLSAGITLATSVVTQITSASIEKRKSKLAVRQQEYQLKRERLDTVYKDLISVVNLYPNLSPNDVLKHIEYAPNYSMESFGSILKSLDYQLEDYTDQLSGENINYERKSDFETQIRNREYAKKKIYEIRDRYFNARDKYEGFCKSNKVIFDIYAGQEVKNCLVEFEVEIHNVFISGRCSGDVDDPLNNRIDIFRRRLVDSIRNDLGI